MACGLLFFLLLAYIPFLLTCQNCNFESFCSCFLLAVYTSPCECVCQMACKIVLLTGNLLVPLTTMSSENLGRLRYRNEIHLTNSLYT